MGNATGKCKHHWRSTVSGASDTMMSALSSRKLRGFILVEVSNCASEKFSRLYQGQVYLSAFPQVQGSVLWERNKCVSFLFKCTLISIEKQPAMQQEQNPLFPMWRLLHEQGCPAKKQMHFGRLSRINRGPHGLPGLPDSGNQEMLPWPIPSKHRKFSKSYSRKLN